MTKKIVDEQTVEVPPKVTVGFSRKVNHEARGGHKYENAEASVYIEVPFSATHPTPEDVEGGTREAFSLAKAIVFDQLGVEYDVDPVSNAVVERVEQQLGGTVVAEEKPKKTVRKAPARVKANEGTGSPASKDDLWEALEADLREGKLEGEDKNGHTHYRNFWDNRPTKVGRQPDFKHKKSGAGLWLDNAPESFPV